MVWPVFPKTAALLLIRRRLRWTDLWRISALAPQPDRTGHPNLAAYKGPPSLSGKIGSIQDRPLMSFVDYFAGRAGVMRSNVFDFHMNAMKDQGHGQILLTQSTRKSI